MRVLPSHRKDFKVNVHTKSQHYCNIIINTYHAGAAELRLGGESVSERHGSGHCDLWDGVWIGRGDARRVKGLELRVLAALYLSSAILHLKQNLRP